MSGDMKGDPGCGEESTCGFIADPFIGVRMLCSFQMNIGFSEI